MREDKEKVTNIQLGQSGGRPPSPGTRVGASPGSCCFGNIGSGALSKQVLVDVRSDDCILGGREGAVIMTSRLRDTMGLWSTKCLVNFLGSQNRNPRGLCAKPVNGGLVNGEEATGSNQCSEEVMVDGKFVDRALSEAVKQWGVPHVLSDDL